MAYISKMALSCATSPIGGNISYLRQNFDIRFTDSLSQCVNIECIVELRFALNTRLLSIMFNLYSALGKVHRISMALIMECEIFY